jgi:acyl-CoA reductase-like NAD-dependent aldehyde dehydrogenase
MYETTEIGPLITPQEVDRIHEWVIQAKKKGASILCGGTKLSQTCYELPH